METDNVIYVDFELGLIDYSLSIEYGPDTDTDSIIDNFNSDDIPF